MILSNGKEAYGCPECGEFCTDITKKNQDGYFKIACLNCETVYKVKLVELDTKILKGE